MNELLREIEDDIRRERAQNLWKSFGRMAIGVSIAVIAITVATVVWQEHQKSYATAQTTQFIKGLDRLKLEDYKGAIAAFTELTEDEDSSYYGLAMLRKAEAERLSGDRKAAMETYRALAEKGEGGDNAAFTGLAKMLVSGEPGKALEPSESSPYYYAEREWKAWQLTGQEKKKEAVEQFVALRDDPRAPVATRARAKIVLEHMAPELPPAKESGDADE